MAKFRFKVLDGVHVEEGFPTVAADDCPYCDASGKRRNGLPCRLCVGVVANMTIAQLTTLANSLRDQTGIEVPRTREGLLELLRGKRFERTEQRFRARSPFDPEDYVGDIIETDVDLAKVHNPKGCPPKFLDLSKDHNLNELERLKLELAQYKARHGELPASGPTPGAGPGAPARDFNEMNMDELRAIAAEEEIDVPQGVKKAQLVELLSARRKQTVA